MDEVLTGIWTYWIEIWTQDVTDKFQQPSLVLQGVAELQGFINWFCVYLTIIFNGGSYIAPNSRNTVNDSLERKRSGTVVAYFKVPFQNWSGRKPWKLSRVSRSPVTDSNSRSAEHCNARCWLTSWSRVLLEKLTVAHRTCKSQSLIKHCYCQKWRTSSSRHQ